MRVRLCASSLQFPPAGGRGEPPRGQQAASQTAVGGQEGEGVHVCPLGLIWEPFPAWVLTGFVSFSGSVSGIQAQILRGAWNQVSPAPPALTTSHRVLVLLEAQEWNPWCFQLVRLDAPVPPDAS